MLGERSVFKEMSDIIHVEAAAEKNHALDSLRETKDDKYFNAVLALPMEEQYAEMKEWTVEDHAAFARHCWESPEDDEGDEDFFASVETPRIESGDAFDEENHFE